MKSAVWILIGLLASTSVRAEDRPLRSTLIEEKDDHFILNVDSSVILQLPNGKDLLVPPHSIILWPAQRDFFEEEFNRRGQLVAKLNAQNQSLRKSLEESNGPDMTWIAVGVLTGFAAGALAAFAIAK